MATGLYYHSQNNIMSMLDINDYTPQNFSNKLCSNRRLQPL